MTNNVTFTNVQIQGNIAIKNTVSLLYANAVFNNSEFYVNTAQYQTKNLFVGYSNVVIQGTEFRGSAMHNPKATADIDETLGSHIYAILDSNL